MALEELRNSRSSIVILPARRRSLQFETKCLPSSRSMVAGAGGLWEARDHGPNPERARGVGGIGFSEAAGEGLGQQATQESLEVSVGVGG